jgi:hypothetical protein
MRTDSITKELTANDTGETGTHQAGILVPKNPEILNFFPALAASTKNPRHEIQFIDPSGQRWRFNFVYYNNKFFGGTRNEYRLTCMTKYLRSHNLKAGDQIILSREEDSRYVVKFKRRRATTTSEGPLRLGSTWKVVTC